MLVRLAWHSAGSYGKAKNDGGSNGGTIRYAPEINHGGNAGLKHAIGVLAPIKENNPGVSWADLIIYAGVVAIENMGGPVCGFTPGRSDAPSPNTAPSKDKRFTPDDRLPDAAQGAAHLRAVFGRMGFDDREIVALSGAHAVGRCHTDRSGFWGPWTYAEAGFSNVRVPVPHMPLLPLSLALLHRRCGEWSGWRNALTGLLCLRCPCLRFPSTTIQDYFKFLLEKKWTVKKTHEGKAWDGPKQYEADGGKLMMLPMDMVLIEDPSFRKWVQVYAKSEDAFFADFAKAFQKLTELGFKQ